MKSEETGEGDRDREDGRDRGENRRRLEAASAAAVLRLVISDTSSELTANTLYYSVIIRLTSAVW